LPYPADDLNSVHIRESQIEKDDIRFYRNGGRQGRPPVCRLIQREFAAFKGGC